MDDIFIRITVSLFGLIIGSFLTVCIYRIPRGRLKGNEEDDLDFDLSGKPTLPEGHATVRFNEPRRSICISCGKQLLWWHNIPFFSWLILGGKCAFCKTKIPFRYPLVELLSGLAALSSYELFSITPTGAVIYAFTCALIVITFIDLDYFIIPNLITLPGFAVGVALSFLNGWTGYFDYPIVAGPWECLFGVLFGGGFLFLVSEVYLRLRRIEGLGMGDVKLLAMTGAFFGPEGSLVTIFVGSLIGSVVGLAVILIRRQKMSQQIPFGPYLAIGTLLYIFVLKGFFAFGELGSL